MTMTRRAFVGASAVFLAAIANAAAASLPPKEAEAFVEKLVAELIAIVRSATPSDTRADEFLDLFKRTTALSDIARFTMGANWRAMTDAQREAFVEAFERYAARVYSNRFGEYNGQTVVVTGSQDMGRRGVLVRSVVRSPNQQDLAVEWLVGQKDGRAVLVDIVAEGVSLSITQREEFAAMVDRRGGDIDRFIADLEQLG